MAKRCLPGVAKWSMFAGGTSCPDRAHGYSYHGSSNGNYAIEPSCPRGRLVGYRARFENVKGRSRFSGLHHDIGGVFRSAAAAAAAANNHCEQVNAGLAGSRRRRRRRR